MSISSDFLFLVLATRQTGMISVILRWRQKRLYMRSQSKRLHSALTLIRGLYVNVRRTLHGRKTRLKYFKSV